MKLVTTTDNVGRKLDEFKAVEIIKKAGFDALDYSMFRMNEGSCPLCENGYREYAKELRDFADSLDIPFVQAHAPFPSYNAGDPAYTKMITPYIKRSIEVAGILGIEHLIIHPVSPTQKPHDEELKAFNLSFYRSLLPYAKEYNVKICLENMWGRDKRRGYIVPNVCSLGKDLAEYVDALDSPYFVACLDLGHCGLVGEEASDAIRVLGKERLKALHVHDNDFKSDSHTLPFLGKMDWNGITAALRDIDYEGNLTYEADAMFARFPADEGLLLSAERFMHDVGRYLIKMIKG